MNQDNNSINNSTIVTQEHNTIQNTQQDNGLTKGMKWFQVLSVGLPSLGRGLCWLIVFAFLFTVMWWIWGGTIPPNDVVEIGKTYFLK